MECEKLKTLERLAVTRPESLRQSPWQEHIQVCGQCREAWLGLERSLAVYCQLEAESRGGAPLPPDWSRLFQVIDGEQRRNRLASLARMPVAAAVVTLFMVTGLAMWRFQPGMETMPSPTIASNNPVKRPTIGLVGVEKFKAAPRGETPFESPLSHEMPDFVNFGIKSPPAGGGGVNGQPRLYWVTIPREESPAGPQMDHPEKGGEGAVIGE
ncbi:MAG: hypothetical protein OEW12_00570 [Deltaproteobacteria bacterium]|nr:hypothetical protein [Deltaproteobacteria bacterium]